MSAADLTSPTNAQRTSHHTLTALGAGEGYHLDCRIDRNSRRTSIPRPLSNTQPAPHACTACMSVGNPHTAVRNTSIRGWCTAVNRHGPRDQGGSHACGCSRQSILIRLSGCNPARGRGRDIPPPGGNGHCCCGWKTPCTHRRCHCCRRSRVTRR